MANRMTMTASEVSNLYKKELKNRQKNGQTTTQPAQQNTVSDLKMSADEVSKMYNDILSSKNANNIPKLEDMGQNNSAPSTSVSMPNLDDLRSQLADTSTNRTEGETKALEDYIKGIEGLKQNTYKQNYNSEIEKVKNTLNGELTEGEKRANEEYLSGLQTLQNEIDRYNTPKYVSTKSNSDKKSNNKDQEKSKVGDYVEVDGRKIPYSQYQAMLRNREKNESATKNYQPKNDDVVEINGNKYSKEALAERRQANKEYQREKKLLKAEEDTVKGFYSEYRKATDKKIAEQVALAGQMIRRDKQVEHKNQKQAESNSKAEEFANAFSNLAPQKETTNADFSLPNTESNATSLYKTPETDIKPNNTYTATPLELQDVKYNAMKGNVKRTNDYVVQRASDFKQMKTEGNTDVSKAYGYYLDLDRESQDVVQTSANEIAAMKGDASPNKDLYIKLLMDKNPSMNYETAAYMINNADTILDSNNENVEDISKALIKSVVSKGKMTPTDEDNVEKMSDYYSEKYGKTKGGVGIGFGGGDDVFSFLDNYGKLYVNDSTLKNLVKNTFGVSDEDYPVIRDLWTLRIKGNELNALKEGFLESVPFYSILRDEDNPYYNAMAESTSQNLLSGIIGRLGGETSKYATMGKLIESIPALSNVSKAIESSSLPLLGEKAGQFALDTAVDIGLDTIPNMINDIAEGKDFSDVSIGVLKNIATNIGFNVGADVLLSAISKAAKKLELAKANDKIDDVLSSLSDSEKDALEQEVRKSILEEQKYASKIQAEPIGKRSLFEEQLAKEKSQIPTLNELSDDIAKQEDKIINNNPIEEPTVNPEVNTVDDVAKKVTSNTEKYSDSMVTMRGKKGQISENNLKEYTTPNSLGEFVGGEDLSRAFAERGYDIMENGGHNDIFDAWSDLIDAHSHGLRNKDITADSLAQAFDELYLSAKSDPGNWRNVWGDILDRAEKLDAEKGIKYTDGGRIIYPDVNVTDELGNVTTYNDYYSVPKVDNVANAPKNVVDQGNVISKVDDAKTLTNQPTNIPKVDNTKVNNVSTPDVANSNSSFTDSLPKTKRNEIDTDALPIDKQKTRIDDNSYNGNRNMTIAKTNIQDEIKDSFISNPRTHEVLSNKDTYAKAEFLISNSKDIDEARNIFTRLVSERNPVAIPMGYEIADRLAKEGRFEDSVAIIDRMSEELTKSGQFSQAAAITMLKNNPVSARLFIEKKIAKLNTEGAEKYGKRWKNFELTQAEKDTFTNLKNGDTEGIENAFENIYKRLAKEYPSSLWEKTVEATKLAMMLNPRTHIRNVGANMMLLPFRSLSDRVSALGQNAYKLFGHKDFEVTQSLKGGSFEQKKLARQIFDERMKPMLENTDKWSDATGIIKNKQVFKDSKIGTMSKNATMTGLNFLDSVTNGKMSHFIEGLDESMKGSIMENLRNFDYYLLSTIEDDPFVRTNFVNRLASYMSAQNIKSIDDVTDSAIDIAWDEALKATFKDDNFMTKAFIGIKNATGKFGEFLLPFTKTPSNIAMRGLDYSLVGIALSVKDYLKVAKNKRTASDVAKLFDGLAKATVGTAGIYLGYQLAKNGVITGTLPSNKNANAFAKATGKLPFAIKLGDGSYYTYDWAQPAAIPLILGTAVYESVNADEKEEKSFWGTALEGTKEAVNSWADLSPLQSFQDLFKTDPVTDKVDIAQNIFDTVANFPQRLIPSVSGAIARTQDPIQRETYVAGDSGQTWLNTAQSKIPTLTQDLPAKRDGWGRPIERQSSVGQSAIANFLNPGQLSNDRSTPIDPEIQRLFDDTQLDKVYPKTAAYSVKDGDGNKITLNNYNHSELQKEMGELSYNLAETFINSDAYDSLPDPERVEVLSSMYNLAERYAQNKLFGTEIKSGEDLIEMINNGDYQGVVDNYVSSANNSMLTDEMKAKGYKVTSTTKELYQNGDTEKLDKLNQYQAKAEQYGNYNVTVEDVNKMDKMSSEREKEIYLMYKQEIKNRGISDNEKSYDAFKSGKLDSYEKTYLPVIEETGASDTQTNYEYWKKYGPINLRNKIAQDEKDAQEKEALRMPEIEKVYGGKQKVTQAKTKYEQATDYFPKLSATDWATEYRRIDAYGDEPNGTITQKEMLGYLNMRKVTSQEEANNYWSAYGDSWKTVPYLKDGEWKAKTKSKKKK